MNFLYQPIMLGIVVAIPPGSVTIIACQRALQFGFRNSLFFTIGSCLSDIFYLTLVYNGVTYIFTRNQYFKIALWFVCGILLILLGLISLISIRNNQGIEDKNSSFQSNKIVTIVSGILVTLSNPMTIVGWIAVAGNFLLIWNNKNPNLKNFGFVTIFFIMLGVLIWFIPLVFIVSKLKKKINEKFKKWFIIFSNLCLILFGFIAFYYAFVSIYDIG